MSSSKKTPKITIEQLGEFKGFPGPKQLTVGLAPPIYPPDPFRLARPARPLMSYFVPRKS